MSRTVAEQIVESTYTGRSPAIVAGDPVTAIADVTETVDLDGADTVDEAALEATVAELAGAINDILAALRAFNIVAT